MSNTILTNSIIAKESLMILENELVLANLVYREHEKEFKANVNGYTPGQTISIRKPARYTLRNGANMTVQDSTEVTTPLTVNTQLGVDLGGWTSADRTLSIPEFSKRFLQSGMKTIAQGIDAQVAALYKDIWNWVGTPGTALTTFAGFAKAPQRMDEMAVPSDDRSVILNPADNWGLVSTFTGLYINDTAKTALQKAKLPMLGGVDAYMSQNAPQHTVGTKAGSGAVNGANQNVTYSQANAFSQTLITNGWTNSSAILKKGDVITLAGVNAVNPVPTTTGTSKPAMSYVQQFVVGADATADGSGNATITISPPIITSGAYQTVSAAPGGTAVITVLGTASTTYNQNLAFHRNAFALAVVPMIKPEGAVDVQTASYNGLSMRMIPVYTGSSDTSAWRVDVLLGTKTIYADLACRMSGT